MVRDVALIIGLLWVVGAHAAAVPCNQLDPAACPVADVRSNGADCTGAADATSAVAAAITAVTPTGGTVWVPGGCVLLLASPGAGNASLTLPSNVTIRCEDQSAGFRMARRYCAGGTYPGAACDNTSNECHGGGTCTYDVPSTKYAPTGGSTYTVMKSAANAVNVGLEGCSIWTGQAELYQRCNGGTNDDDPCYQVCASGTLTGFACNADADCTGGGTCSNIADCKTAGGECSSATGELGKVPHSATGAGKINPIDFSTASYARVHDVAIHDHFVGDFAVKVGVGGVVDTVDAQATTPRRIVDGATFAGLVSFYGAYAGAVSTVPIQPTVSVANGLVAGADVVVRSAKFRGSTTHADVGANARLTNVYLGPHGLTNGGNGPGPGTGNATEGLNATTDAAVHSTRIGNVATTGVDATTGLVVRDSTIAGSPTTGINATTYAQITGSTFTGQGTTSVNLTTNARVLNNRWTDATGPTTGIVVTSDGQVENNVLTAATGIKLGDRSTAYANVVSPFATYGVQTTGEFAAVSYNYVASTATNAIGFHSGSGSGGQRGHRFVGNTAYLNGTATKCIYLTNGQSQVVISDNACFYPDAAGIAGTYNVGNVTVDGNRIFWGTGPKVIVQAAGWSLTDNYLAWGTTSADGIIQVGGDATGGTNVQASAAYHTEIVGNRVHTSDTGALSLVKFLNMGKRCNNNAVGSSCASTPYAVACECTTDADCRGPAASTTTTTLPGADILCAGDTHREVLIASNNLYSIASAHTGVDLSALASGSNTLGTIISIMSNAFAMDSGSTSIKFPSSGSALTKIVTRGNAWSNIATPIANWSGAFGTLGEAKVIQYSAYDPNNALPGSFSKPSIYLNRGGPKQLLSVCCEVDAGTLKINPQHQDAGSTDNLFSSALTCGTNVQGASPSGCTSTFAGSENEVGFGDNLDMVVTENTTAKRLDVVFVALEK